MHLRWHSAWGRRGSVVRDHACRATDPILADLDGAYRRAVVMGTTLLGLSAIRLST